MKNLYITSASRTAVGSLGKSLKNESSDKLGSSVISDVIKKSKINENEIDEVIMGQVLTGGTGQNPARQAATTPNPRGARSKGHSREGPCPARAEEARAPFAQ